MLKLKRNTLSVALWSALLALSTGARAETDPAPAAEPAKADDAATDRDAKAKEEARKKEQATTLMNGRDPGSVGDNRTVEFDQHPSELINQVVVYKTPDAELVGQGLSGTIDLHTVRPLDFPDRVVSVNVRGEKNSLGNLNPEVSEYGSRLSAFYIDQFMDNELGIALGYARLDSPGERRSWEAWGYPTGIGSTGSAYSLGGEKIQAGSTDNVRQGAVAVVQWDPHNDFYKTTLDVYYSKFEKSEYTRFLETGLGWSGAQLTNPVIENGVVVGGDYVGVRPVLRNDLNEGNDKLFAIGWRNEFKFSDNWSGVLDLSHSKADRDESILETYSGTTGQTDTAHLVLDPNGPANTTFGLDYTDPSRIAITDPGGWGQEGYVKFPQIKDKLDSYRFDVERKFADGGFSAFKFGVNYADREKSRSVPEYFLDLKTGNAAFVAPEFLLDPVREGNGLDGTLTYRINSTADQYFNLRPNAANADILNKQWTVEEKLTTAYVQFDIQTELDGLPIRGNLGIQAVHADQQSDGFSVVGGNVQNPQPISGGTDYTDYLPSLNLAFSFPYEITTRVGIGRQAARPRIDQMRAHNNAGLSTSQTGNIPAGTWTAGGGNPNLRPWEANAFDLSVEKYFDGKGYFSVAYFFKELKTYVFDAVTTFDASSLTPPPGYTGPPPNPVGILTGPTNGTGGTLHGFEVTASIPLGMWWDSLEGFGIVGNFSDTDSSIKRLGPNGPNEPIAGLSKQVRNLSVYYENYGFQARASLRSRSPFLGEIQGFGADRSFVYIGSEQVVDLQTGYTFSEDSMFKGTTILLQVNNATDERYRQFFNDSKLTQYYSKYGR